MPNEFIPVLYGEQVAGEAARARQELERLVNTVYRSNFDIAEAAWAVKKSGDFAGHTTFKEYGKTLNIKLRKLQYLVRIAEIMEVVGVPREQYEPLGIAKCREITSLEPSEQWKNPETNQKVSLTDFIRGFVERGRDMSLDDIQQHVRTLKGFDTDDEFVFRNFKILRSVAESSVDPALAMTKMQIGSVGRDDEGTAIDASDGACLEIWAVSYLNDPNNQVFVEFEPEGTQEDIDYGEA